MKIDIGVGGRFWSDRLAEVLRADGNDVRLYSTLPRSRFPTLPVARVHSFVFPEIVFRLAGKLGFSDWGDLFKIEHFGRELAAALAQGEPADLFIGWSSFSLETIRHRNSQNLTSILVRDSCHITHQTEALKREYAKWGGTLPDRGRCVVRELEEYALATRVWVPSPLARRTFIEQGADPFRVDVVELGADLSVFRPAAKLAPAKPLRVVYFGSLSIRKGIPYLLEATKKFAKSDLELLLIGSVEPACAAILAKHTHFTHLPAQRQEKLSDIISAYHVAVLPSIEDGFGLVVPQAMAAGLIPVVSRGCGAVELIRDGQNGFSVPVADSRSLTGTFEKILGLSEADRTMIRDAAMATAQKTTWKRHERSIRSLVGGLRLLGSVGGVKY
jgi:starch synthase